MTDNQIVTAATTDRQDCRDNPHKKRCRELRLMRKLAAERERLQLKFDRALGKVTKTLEDWAREADECGLDYGTYRALRSQGKTFEELKALADNRPCTFHSHCRIFK